MKIYLGLGSNLGRSQENISKAVELLRSVCDVKRVSPLYETEPMYHTDQGPFINCVVEAETDLKPLELLDELKAIEKKLGRTKTVKYGPRTIDLDILFYGEKIIDSSELRIPHPKLHERLFVLRPLMDLCPDHVHPILKKTVTQLYSNIV